MNHALFKPLLFFASGSVIHAAHTRQLDRMGGLAARMPASAMAFLVGAVAICGLPPLNGFMSELLVYLGLFRTLGVGSGASCVAASLAVPALAMIGALAVACFVRVFGVVFLGEPRSEEMSHAHESSILMLGPMALLAMCCFAVGLFPLLVSPILDEAVKAWLPAVVIRPVTDFVPLRTFSQIGVSLLAAIVLGIVLLRRRMQRSSVGTWDCGYVAPTARMQYTGSSLAQILVDLFAWVLRTRKDRPRIEGPFPRPARFESQTGDLVQDGVVLPAFRGIEGLVLRARSLVRGRSQLNIFYILVFILVLLIMAGRGNGGLP